MIIAAEFSFNQGREFTEKSYENHLEEVREIIFEVDSSKCKTKKSEEKTMPGRIIYSPKALNKEFKKGFKKRGWGINIRQKCNYSDEYYVDGYSPKELKDGAFREMDFIKDKLGVEVQFGKYAFMVYNVCAKMTIFNKLGFIDIGIEIVPVKNFADEMSTGVSYFEQFVWDLEQRGVSDIDIPVLILGVDK
ncbi:hypothetical protein ES707_14888 [subsurface metagenome]